MAGEITSTNMLMPIPGVGVTAGPTWASDINSCLQLIDVHDHSSGSGVPITPAGMSINSDLTFNNNNLTSARSLRLAVQSGVLAGASDLGCLYEVGVDLYYNDGNGSNVRITQSGGVAGSPGSISNLTSPASAAYVSGSTTFVWQSAANTPANMDAASYILRNLSANSKGLTLNPPNAMGSDYSITLPSLPASQKFMSLDASGNMGATWAVDGSTIVVSSNQVKVPDGGITRTQQAAVGQQISSSCGTYSVPTDQAFHAVTNLSVTITTTGRPVMLMLIPDGTTSNDGSISSGIPVSSAQGQMRFVRNSTSLTQVVMQDAVYPGIPPHLDTPSSGTYTYTVTARIGSGGTMSVSLFKLAAYEL